jgi:hypothetical protein
MSQSDYIKYKRVQRQLNEFNRTPHKIPNVLHSSQYISYKEYALENTIVSENGQYDKLIDQDVPIVFGMVKKCASNSPTFLLCSGTQLRGNRMSMLPLDDDEMPLFRYPKNETISKSNRMKWNSVKNTRYCTVKMCGT